jgi:hypothetical protein
MKSPPAVFSELSSSRLMITLSCNGVIVVAI